MKKSICLLLTIVMLLFTLPLAAAAVEGEAPVPFAYSNAKLQTEPLSMSAKNYNDAILFSMGYTGISNGGTSEVTYNFKGQYASVSFDAGFVKGDERNAAMSVIADGTVLLDADEIVCTDIAQRYTVPLAGIQKLTIRFTSSGYDKTHYAIGNIVAEPLAPIPEEQVLVSAEGYDSQRYFLQRASVVTGDFSMGGYPYRNGYKLTMGYNGTSKGYTGIVGFNFNGEYKSMSFDIAKFMNRINESYTRSAQLTIEADGTVLPGYDARELLWNDVSLPVELDLTGVNQLLIKVHSNGYDTVYWYLGNIQLQDIHNHVSIPAKAPTCTEDGLTEGEQCSDCGKVFREQESVPATGHTETTDDAVDPTCTKSGLTEGSHCSVCDTVLTAQKKIPATGHQFKNGVCQSCTAVDMKKPTAQSSNVLASGKPKITWKAVDGGVQYQLFRSTKQSSGFKKISTTTKLSYTDTTAKAGTKYYYKVKAVDHTGHTSAYSNCVQRTCDLARPVVTASNVSSSGKVKLTWDAVEGAKSYKVYRATSTNGKYILMKTVTETSYVNSNAKAGTKYYYKVKAIHKNTDANSALSAVTVKRCDLSLPEVTIKRNDAGKPRLTWKKVSGAVRYEVLCSTSKNGKYTRLGSTTNTYWVHKKAVANKTYFYKVRALHTNSDAHSAYSSPKSIKAK